MMMKQAPEGHAIRTESNYDLPAAEKDMHAYSQVFRDFVKQTNDVVKNNISSLFESQFEELKTILLRAIHNSENNSLLLLGRRKQIIHAFLNQMEREIMFISDANKGTQP